MRILVTGGAGFIGSHLCEALLKQQHALTIVDNLDEFYEPAMKRRNLEKISRIGSYRFHETDIRSTEALRLVLKEGDQVDALVHLAATAGVRQSWLNPQKYIDTNVAGTLNVLELAKDCNIKRLVYASSSSVYGGITELPARENVVGRPLSPYAATKLAGEAFCSAFAAAYGISTICLRFFTVFGPRQRPDMAFGRFARLLKADAPITVFGDGSSSRDYTFVSDTVDGIIAALSYECSYDIFNIGTARAVKIVEVLDVMGRLLGVKPHIVFEDMKAGDPARTLADMSKAISVLKLRPKVSFEDGMKRFLSDLCADDMSVPVS